MKLPSIISRWFTKASVEPMTPANSSGLIGWLGSIGESFSGAWQSNIVLDGPRDILSFSGVFAPLTLIASDIAKIGASLLVESESGIKKKAPKVSPFWRAIKRPNHYQNWLQFVEQWMLSKLLYGNTYILKVRESRTMVAQLYILDVRRVKTMIADSGDVFYELAADPLSELASAVKVPATEIIHDRWNCLWHPLVGVSPLYSAALSATMGRKIQANSVKFFRNMSRPSGMLTAPAKISDEVATRLKREFEENFSGDNLGKLAVLGDSLKYEAMTIPAEQAQLIEQLEWAARDTAAAFHMPLFKVGGPIPVGSTIEALNLMYYADCLQVLIEAAEECLESGLELPEGYCVEFEVENLARMDTMSQVTALGQAVKDGWMAPDEARAKRNLPAVAGGNTPYLQQQNYSLAALAKRDAQADPFGTAKPAAPAPAEPPAPPADAGAKFLADMAEFELALTRKMRDEIEAMHG